MAELLALAASLTSRAVRKKEKTEFYPSVKTKEQGRRPALRLTRRCVERCREEKKKERNEQKEEKKKGCGKAHKSA